MNDAPPVNPVAAEIHAKFVRKMKPGGLIDKILNGGEPVHPRPALPEAELTAMKNSIETQLDEYEAAIKAAKAWVDSRRPKGFRKTLR